MTAANQKKQSSASKPFTVRLSDSERSDLEHRAGELPLGAYVKCVLFADGDKQEHRGPRAPTQDRAVMASLLARMKDSRVPSSCMKKKGGGTPMSYGHGLIPKP